MTVEELEILVDASIEPAINKLKKLMPQIKQTVTQAVETANKGMQNINTEQVQGKVKQTVQRVKKHFQELKKSTENNEIAIKVNNKEAIKQITQIEKEIDSLEKKISSRQMKLDALIPQISNRKNDIINSYTPEGISPDDPKIQPFLNQKINSDKELQSMIAQAEELRKKINDDTISVEKLKEEAKNVKLSNVNNIDNFKQKIDSAKNSVGEMRGQLNKMPKLTQNISNNMSNVGSKLKSGLRHVIKYAAALLSIRGIYGLLRNTASAWLSSQNEGAQQLSANIEYMKYAMGSALAPVIQFVTNLVYTLLKAIQQVAYALTGVNIFAKATASSMKSTAGSAKKAKKEVQRLADIDEIHNIQKDNGSDSGSGSGGTPSPTFDLSKMDKISNSIIDALKKGDWYEVGAEIGRKLNKAMSNIPWDKIKEGARNLAKGLANFLNGLIENIDWTLVGETLAEGINTAIEFLYTFITTFNWRKFGKAISDSINGFIKKIDWKKVGQTISEAIKGLLDFVIEFIKNLDFEAILKAISDFVQGIKWADIMKKISELFGTAWGKYMKLHIIIGKGIAQGIVDSINYWKNKVNECGGDIVLGILKGITDSLKDIVNWIYNNMLKPFIDGFKEAFEIHSPSRVMQRLGKNIVEGLKEGLKGIWNSVKDIISNLAKNMKNKFTEAKKKVVDVFTSMKTKIKSIFDGIWTNIKKVINSILGGIEKMANGVVRGLNKVIDAMNKLKFKIPDWVPGSMGGKEFGFNIGTIGEISIPRLAKGGVLYDDTIIRAGEYSNARRNPEIITPQNIMADTFEKVLAKYNNGNSSIYGEAELKVNGKTLARATIFDFNNEAKRLGYKPILQRG